MSQTSSLQILLVDDERNIRQTLSVTLQSWGHEVTLAASPEEATAALRSRRFDLMLTDFKLGSQTGIELVRTARQTDASIVSVLMTAFASFDNAVQAIREGAFDYLPKPFSNTQLQHVMTKVGVIVDLKRENQKLRSSSHREDYFRGQTSPAMQRLEEFVRKVGPTEASVLLVGESGTGKTELARLIHARSSRADRAFVLVNCATLADSLLESELFGHAKGAFTGATSEHVGKLELAHRGTVLLDEIGDLSLQGQTKLLRFLQEKVIERVGSNRSIPLDVRVLAATNRNLEDAVAEGQFREDLYFRLNMFECQVPPLRYRKEDLPVLVERFLKDAAFSSGLSAIPALPVPIRKKIEGYSWPGNVRELRNVIERLILLSQGREMSVDDLPNSVVNPERRPSAPGQGELKTLEELEREQIERVLAAESNQEKAAKILGITTVTLWRKRKQLGLP